MSTEKTKMSTEKTLEPTNKVSKPKASQGRLYMLKMFKQVTERMKDTKMLNKENQAALDKINADAMQAYLENKEY